MTAETEKCKWDFDCYDFAYSTPYYNTGCERFTEGDDDFKHCPYCGKEIGYE